MSFSSCCLLIWERCCDSFFFFFIFFLSFGFLPHTDLAVRIWSEFCPFYSCKYFIEKHGIAFEPKLQPGLPRVLHSLISIICCVCAGAKLILLHLLGAGVRGRPWAAEPLWDVLVLCCTAPWPCTGFSGILQRLWHLNPSSLCLGKFVLHGVKWFYPFYKHWSCSARFGLLLCSVILPPYRRSRSCCKQEKLGMFLARTS